jgi:hypothetical protein
MTDTAELRSGKQSHCDFMYLFVFVYRVGYFIK